jgi:hypothetical protein
MVNPQILEKFIKQKQENSDDEDDNQLSLPMMIDSTKKNKRRPTKVHIRDELEKDANTERVKSLRISDPDRLYVLLIK